MSDIQEAIKFLKEGKPIIIVDDKNRENEGDLVVSSQTITDETANFMVMHSSGVICITLTEEQMDNLELPMMVSKSHEKDKFSTAFAYSIEASFGVTTGISAKDRAHTIRTASNPAAKAKDIISPGHVFPLKAKKGLLDERKGHTEASIEMCLLSSLNPSAAIVEICNNVGNMMKGEELNTFAKTYRLPIVSIEEIIEYKKKNNSGYYIEKISESLLPTEFGDFEISVWNNKNKEELVVLKKGDLKQNNIPVRLHSKCLTGDVFHSLKCDCNQQLHNALNYINNKGYGLLLYLDQEGRGLTLADKIKTYALQEKGFDTIEANLKIGKPVDARTWDYAIEVLKQFNLTSIELLTNNPDKIIALKKLYSDSNLKIKSLPSKANKHNKDYLQTKLNKMKHTIDII